MSYIINIDEIDYDCKKNISLNNKIKSLSECKYMDFIDAINKLSEEDSFLDYLEDKYGTTMTDVIQASGDDIEEIIEGFIDYFNENNIGERYDPMMSYAHVLSSEHVSNDSLELLEQYTPNIAILHIGKGNINVISLTAGGTDLSSEIELAYYFVDGKSPISASFIDLSDDAKDIYDFCKNRVKERGFVNTATINEFIRNKGK